MFHSMYQDFIRFLDALETENAWEAYKRYYYLPHKDFLDSYWNTFRWMDLRQIQDRVTNVKREDYSTLLSLLWETDLEGLVKNILAGCMNLIEAPEEPEVYFMVGFFSADGFVLELGGQPVIGFGLERFKSWKPLPILFAHEYAHFLRHLWKSDEPYIYDEDCSLRRCFLSEGISTVFSELLFPEYPLREHLFLSEERLRWCQDNKEDVMDIAGQILQGKRDASLLWHGNTDLGIPPRVGNFIGYSLVKEYVTRHPEFEFQSLLQLNDIKDALRDGNQE